MYAIDSEKANAQIGSSEAEVRDSHRCQISLFTEMMKPRRAKRGTLQTDTGLGKFTPLHSMYLVVEDANDSWLL